MIYGDVADNQIIPRGDSKLVQNVDFLLKIVNSFYNISLNKEGKTASLLKYEMMQIT